MTEDRVPTTEAGRRLIAGPNMGRAFLSDVLAIEAEASAAGWNRANDAARAAASEQPAPPIDVLYILGEATRRPITLDEYEVVRSALRASEQPAPALNVEQIREMLRRQGYSELVALIPDQPAPPLDVPRLLTVLRSMPTTFTVSLTVHGPEVASRYARLGSAATQLLPDEPES